MQAFKVTLIPDSIQDHGHLETFLLSECLHSLLSAPKFRDFCQSIILKPQKDSELEPLLSAHPHFLISLGINFKSIHQTFRKYSLCNAETWTGESDHSPCLH